MTNETLTHVEKSLIIVATFAEEYGDFFNYLPAIIFYPICILGVTADALLIYIIWKSIHLHSKTDFIVLHFALSDFVSVLAQIIDFILSDSPETNCFGKSVVLFKTASELFIWSLLIDVKVTLKTLLIRIYVTIAILFVAQIINCFTLKTEAIVSTALVGIIFVNFITLLVKEARLLVIHQCWNLDMDVKFRMNVSRIYILTWLLYYLGFIFFSRMHLITAYFYITFRNLVLLAPFFIFLYVIFADEDYMTGFRNIFKRRSQVENDTEMENKTTTA